MKFSNCATWSLTSLILAACPDKSDSSGSGTIGTTEIAATEGTDGTAGAETDATTSAGGSSTGAGVMNGCETLVAGDKKQLELVCLCYVEMGSYPDLASCLAGNSGGEEIDACICALVAEDPTLEAYVACIAEVHANYVACIEQLACPDLVAGGNCGNIAIAAYAICDQTLKSSAGKIDLECYGSPPFACGSGEEISSSFVCDGFADCTDMSDESMCL